MSTKRTSLWLIILRVMAYLAGALMYLLVCIALVLRWQYAAHNLTKWSRTLIDFASFH